MSQHQAMSPHASHNELGDWLSPSSGSGDGDLPLVNARFWKGLTIGLCGSAMIVGLFVAVVSALS